MFSEGDIVLLRTGKSRYTEVIFVRMSEDVKLAKGTWHNTDDSTRAQPYPSQSPTAVIKLKPDGPEETVLLEYLKATN